MAFKVGETVHYIHNEKVEYKDEVFNVNNGGMIESRTRKVRVDTGEIDQELPFVIVKVHPLSASDPTPLYDGWLFGEDDSRYLKNVLEGNPSTPGTIHKVD